MSTKRTIAYVLLFVIVLGILIGGGFAVYRLGYMHGIRESGQFALGGRFSPGFWRGFHTNLWDFRGRVSYFPIAIPGFFTFLGFLALIILAISGFVALTQRGRIEDNRPSDVPPTLPTLEDG